jgi:hypothetical protein
MGLSSAEGSEDGGKLMEQHRTTDLSCLECSKRTVSREKNKMQAHHKLELHGLQLEQLFH